MLATGAFRKLDFNSASNSLPMTRVQAAGFGQGDGPRAPLRPRPPHASADTFSPTHNLRLPEHGGILPRPHRPLPADSGRRDSCGSRGRPASGCVRPRARRAPGCRGAAAQPSFSSTDRLEAFPHLFLHAGGLRPRCRSRRASGSSFPAGASGSRSLRRGGSAGRPRGLRCTPPRPHPKTHLPPSPTAP